MSLARGRAFSALGESLGGIGRFLVDREREEEEKRLRRQAEDTRLLQYASERGGSLGPAPITPPKPFGAPTVGDEFAPPPSTKPSPARTSRFIETPGARSYYVAPDVAAQEVAKVNTIGRIAAQDTQRPLVAAARTDLTPAQIEAHVVGGVPLGDVAPPRPPREPGTRLTIPQAMEILRSRPGYATWDEATSSYKWAVPYEQVYAEAVEMVGGGSMRAPAPAPPAPPSSVETPAPSSGGWMQSIARRLNPWYGASEEVQAPADTAVATPGTPLRPVARPGVPSPAATDRLSEQRRDWDALPGTPAEKTRRVGPRP